VLLVIGAGPYGVATAARAQEQGIDTTVLGHPMGFWTQNMPKGMFLRSGPDWHLDAAGVHTFERFLAERKVSPAEIDPVPIEVFLDYAAWFQEEKGLTVRPDMVESLTHQGGMFCAVLRSGERISAQMVVAAPGIRYFQQRPPWAADLHPDLVTHTCDLVQFDELSEARVLIVGGRQSAYEWAALAGEHGAARVDIVHRHDVPRFARVSWKFADAHLDSTLAHPGWWRGLDPSRRDAIGRQFWEVGRLTLEWWLTPRLAGNRFHTWPGTTVTAVTTDDTGPARVTLSNGTTLTVDRIVLATGYKADLPEVPYLADVIDDIAMDDGFPVLDEAFQSTLPGLYLPGFAATKDFGPFFGFTKGCPAAATLVVNDLVRRTG
jgi:FAD-dependent urate hydroxylase